MCHSTWDASTGIRWLKVEWDISIFAIIFGEFRIISKWKGENQGEEAEGRERRWRGREKRGGRRGTLIMSSMKNWGHFRKKGSLYSWGFGPNSIVTSHLSEWTGLVNMPDHSDFFLEKRLAAWKPTLQAPSRPISPSLLVLQRRGTEPSGRPWSLFLNPLYVLAL